MFSARKRNLFSRALTLTVLLLLALPHFLSAQQRKTSGAANAPHKNVIELRPGQTIERRMEGNDRHLYRVGLQAGEFLQVRVDQKGADIVVRLLSAGGTQIAKMNSPNGTEGFEILSWVAERAGTYLIETSRADGVPDGHYVIARERSRRATEQDRRRVELERLFMSGMATRNSQDEAAKAAALSKFEATQRGWEELHDAYMSGLVDNEVRRLKEPAALPEEGIIWDPLSSAHNINGRIISRIPLKSGKPFVLAVLLKKGEVLRVDAEEHNVNIVLSVGKLTSASSGYSLVESHYGGGHGRETLTFIAEQEDKYHVIIEAEPASAVGKDAWVRLTPHIRSFTSENDRWRAAAEHLMFESLTLTSEGLTDNLKPALENLERAVQQWRQVGDIYWEGYTHAEIGSLYGKLSDAEKVFSSYAQALRLFRAAPSKSGEARALVDLAKLYSQMGDSGLAIDYFQRAAALWEEVGNKTGEAQAQEVLCRFDRLFDSFEQQLACFMRSLSFSREKGDRWSEGLTLNNIGVLYSGREQFKEAKEYFEKAAAIVEEEGSPGDATIALGNLASVYADEGDKEKALGLTQQMLDYSLTRGDIEVEASVYDRMSSLWNSLGKPSLAVFYGKLSVSIYEQMRHQRLGLDKQLQKSLLRKVENPYRKLAALLLLQGRLSEAHQVIEMLKDQQFFDPVDGGAGLESRPVRTLDMTGKEWAATATVNRIRRDVRAVGKPYFELRGRAGMQTRQTKFSPEEEERLRHLERQMKETLDGMRHTHEQIEKDFNASASTNDLISETAETRELRDALRVSSLQTGRKVVAVYTLVADKNFHALIVTPEGLANVSHPIKAAALNEKALKLWALLQSDTYDPRGLAQEIYSDVFRPIEKQLPADTETILWSLDGNLRYLPMGALHDGQRYLIERYEHVVMTRTDRERLTRAPSLRWTGAGFGSSEAHTIELLGTEISFDALPGVKKELQVVFREGRDSKGILEGEVLTDARFTRMAMLKALEKRRPLVHIASHFSFRPGDEARSFLLLGDGEVMSLAEMKTLKDLFAGVELLTLSACNTAAQQPDANGREIDAFAELAQRLGARSVMATLWPVADNSTSWLMREFYKTRQLTTAPTKASALRGAQLGLLARINRSNQPRKDSSQAVKIVINAIDGERGSGRTRADVVYIAAKDAPPYRRDEKKPFAHPYYWAPFILIGNWR